MNEGTIAIIMVFAIPLVAIIGGLAIAALKVLKEGPDRATRQVFRDETQLVQQMHQMLLKMEERIEALETILIEHERAREEVKP